MKASTFCLTIFALTIHSPESAAGDVCRSSKSAVEKIQRCSIVIISATSASQLERALLRRGNAFMELARYSDAVQDFTRLIGLNNRIAGYYDNRANAYKAVGALNDALKDANATLRLAPAAAFAFRTRAFVFDELGKSELAIADITTAIRLNSDDAGLFLDRGKFALKLGRHRDALADFDHALEANPTDTHARRERGLLHKRLGNYDAALEDLWTYSRFEPNDREVAVAIEEINAMRSPDGLRSQTPQRPEPAKASEERSPSVNKSGTGFFVSTTGHVVTNHHVVAECASLQATFGATVPTTARLVAHDVANDLALLIVETKHSTQASLRTGVRIGEPVAAFGYPLSGLLSSNGAYTVGTVSSLAGLQDDARYLQISAPVQPGNSGGPVVDQNGNVVGVVVSKLDAIKIAAAIDDLPQNVNFAIKTSVLVNFLEAHGVLYTSSSTQSPLQPTELAERAKAISVFIQCNNRAR